MRIEHLKHVHLLGIGGIGMSALARYFHAIDVDVSGYDKTSTPLTRDLVDEGIEVYFEENINLIPTTFLDAMEEGEGIVIYTPAIPEEHVERKFFESQGIKMYKRAEILGMISKSYYTLAVAGTHGKTTTVSILAHLLNTAGMDFIGFIGGISGNFKSNLIFSKAAELMIVEADEYDRSFLHLHPNVSIITSMDPDHLDIYQTEEQMVAAYEDFTGQLKPGGKLVISASCDNLLNSPKPRQTYALNDQADYQAANVHVEEGQFIFDLNTPNGNIAGLHLKLPGFHNVENAMAAVITALQLHIPENAIRTALATYEGVKRRFEVHIARERFTYIDDYAHHPGEIDAFLRSVREMYPGKKVTGVFQPHLYSRTRDFAREFAESLSVVDQLILLDIYPAREVPIPGVDSNLILDQAKVGEKQLIRKDDLIDCLPDVKTDVLVTMGAGDIDQLVQPIVEFYTGTS